MAREKKVYSLRRLSTWYGKYERPISVISLISGFIFNVFTLTRVDDFFENLWIAVHILVVAICIILINRQEMEGKSALGSAANPEKLHFWMVNVMQFFFGGLLSTFIVFYFRSAVITVTWPFFAILILAFIANESFKRHYARLSFQISFFFLSVYLFAIFLMPVLLREISNTVFLMSGGVSLIVLMLFLFVLKRFTKRSYQEGKRIMYSSVVGIYLLVNGLYFFGLIPPLPLSLQDAGIYHSITRDGKGGYTVTREPVTFAEKMYEYVGVYPVYHIGAGDPVYAFSAIFSPIDFKVAVNHEWQYYNSSEKRWVTSITVPLSVTGGRDSGYRTYSINSGLTTGRWRVNVETASGQTIGRMAFRVVSGVPPTALETLTK